MNLLKLVIPLASLVIGTTAMADYKVGDKMPIKDGLVIDKKTWFNRDLSKSGEILYYGPENNGQAAFMRAYIDCNGRKVFFGYFDGKLYLDNNPNDGIIDSVHDTIKGRGVSNDAPVCGIEI